MLRGFLCLHLPAKGKTQNIHESKSWSIQVFETETSSYLDTGMAFIDKLAKIRNF